MKIGVISDTHIPVSCDELPKELNKHFKGVDMILHAGDIVDQKAIDQLMEICPVVEAVCGNMDSPALQSSLPHKKIIQAGKFKIGLTHGWGPPAGIIERVAKEFKDVDVIVFGHSHQATSVKKKGVLFFNPGSATDMIHSKCRSIGILNIDSKIEAEIIAI
jgi:putative phosphoesterase